MSEKYNVIGLMSGTSLDGLDIAACSFEIRDMQWIFSIEKTLTIPYSGNWKEKLSNAQTLNGLDLIKLHKSYGKYLGQNVNEFLESVPADYDIIASHGHTVFHQPEKRITFQLGDINSIVAETGITTIADFRSLDVALGGQGAPLVPIGDKLLFSEYEFCLNLGGFSNISYDENEQRIAFDPSPANIVLNYLMESLNKSYDKGGETGRTGTLNQNLLDSLNELEYYSKKPPKSLGREWVENEFIPVLNRHDLILTDKLRTVYEHLAIQITAPMEKFPSGKVLVTGGGAHNKFLIERLKANTKHKIVIPTNEIIDFKEAIIFAFLGVLRIRNEVNILASVTGAIRNHSGGTLTIF
jgi:anhydro-N-acetylmuramic acid kinase